MVSSKELGGPANDSVVKKNLARMAAILAILSVSRECIGILNIFYKKVFRSAPLRRGDRLILRSREPVKSQIRTVLVQIYRVHRQYSYSTHTVHIQYRYRFHRTQRP